MIKHLLNYLAFDKTAALSLGTVKNVFRDLRASGAPKPTRVVGDPATAAYIPGYLSRDLRTQAMGMRMPNYQPPAGMHSEIVLPRLGKGQQPMLPQLNNPSLIGLHEAGHAVAPNFDTVGQQSTNIVNKILRSKNPMDPAHDRKYTRGLLKNQIVQERRANQEVLNRVSRYGTPNEAQDYRNFAKLQTRIGYVRPNIQKRLSDQVLNDVPQEQFLDVMNQFLQQRPRYSQIKEILQKYPELRSRNYLPQLKTGSVLAHVAGPSGSGKSTLGDRLAKTNLNLSVKDLDDFDDEAEKNLGYSNTRKNDYTDKMLASLAKARQSLMDEFVKKTNKPIVFVGHHTEGPHVLKIPTKNKFLLDVDAQTSAHRAYLRSQKEDPKYRRTLKELPDDEREAQETIDDLLQKKYKPLSVNQILKRLTAKDAVLITGNPKYIKDNPAADKFYNQVEAFLKKQNYNVSRDPGEPFTQPKDADLWVGHSRGIDRLRFASKGTTTIGLGSPSLKGAINHPKDDAAVGKEPNKYHYKLTPQMKADLLKLL